ncbi:hypothetical protein [Paenibacillus sp. FSL W8-0194]|uniref:hypothetical protein n=1 Tax=Paenibacillus sp. FSL W8-0194 TaxID=2921711 RepID=UPI0030DB3EDB
MEYAFFKKNNGNKNKPSIIQKISTFLGFLSCFLGILSLVIMNIGLLLQDSNYFIFFPQLFFVAGILFGLLGFFGEKRGRTISWWGIGLNVFSLFFSFVVKVLMFFL